MLSQRESTEAWDADQYARKLSHCGKIVRELQELSLSMRMVPLRGTFQKMSRIVRDLSHKSGKQIELVTDDRDTEIDRNMVDIINDVLVHMVRNAVDHGIETPEERERTGKPRNGTITLLAYHSGDNVVIEIRDDGAGMDRERIAERALAKGLLQEGQQVSESELFNLIFQPGFSTAQQVTEVSGRGVGMDVVKQGVEALRGHVHVASVAGEGCCFTIRLPLTLAITDGMLVQVGQERYIIPTASIHLSFRPTADMLFTIGGRGELVMFRDEAIPVFRLHELLNVTAAVEDPTRGLLVVVSDQDHRAALLVDELLGQHQVVAKSLGSLFGKIAGVSGGAILADGRIGLILDPAEMIAFARRRTS
jgi:two-component system chemotaxis sensor kinase CheA